MMKKEKFFGKPVRSILNGNYLPFSRVAIYFLLLLVWFGFGLHPEETQQQTQRKAFCMIIFESNKTYVTWKISPSVMSGKEAAADTLKAALGFAVPRTSWI